MTEFIFKGITFQVRERNGSPQDANGRFEYRDKRHLGGPWSDCIKTVANTSVDLKFRRLLTKATLVLKHGK